MTTAALDVVIVSYRCEAMLRDCLASLERHPASVATAIHVIDNASGDGTAAMVRGEFPAVRLTEWGRNIGFGAATNVGLREGAGEFALVLNPDTRLTEGALDRLLEVLAAEPRVAAAGPRLELEDGSFDHASRRSFPTPLSALGHFTGVGRRSGAGGALAAYRAPEVAAGPVEAINGAFMLLRRAALDQVGGFDERYWMYMEDLDLCYRLHEAGWNCWYEPSVTVTHIKAGTSGQNRSWRLNRAFHYGMFRFYRDHYAPSRPAPVNAAIYVAIAVKLAISALRSAWRRRGATA